MELDTAADYSMMSKSEYLKRFADRPLIPSKVSLKTYIGEWLDVLHERQCNIAYKGKQYLSSIVVAKYNTKPNLLGKNWLYPINLDWGEIFIFSCR